MIICQEAGGPHSWGVQMYVSIWGGRDM